MRSLCCTPCALAAQQVAHFPVEGSTQPGTHCPEKARRSVLQSAQRAPQTHPHTHTLTRHAHPPRTHPANTDRGSRACASAAALSPRTGAGGRTSSKCAKRGTATYTAPKSSMARLVCSRPPFCRWARGTSVRLLQGWPPAAQGPPWPCTQQRLLGGRGVGIGTAASCRCPPLYQGASRVSVGVRLCTGF